MLRIEQEVQEIRARLHDDGNFLGVVTGKVRRGKSTLTFLLLRMIDEGFTPERIYFDAPTFAEGATRIDKYGGLSLDESIFGANRRRSMSSENVGLMNFLTVWGERNLAAFILYPHWFQLDGAIRAAATRNYHVMSRGVCQVNAVVTDEFTGEQRLVPLYRFKFPKYDGPDWQQYLERKAEFVKETGRDENNYRKRVRKAVATAKDAEWQAHVEKELKAMFPVPLKPVA